MDEREWLSSQSPVQMMNYIRRQPANFVEQEKRLVRADPRPCKDKVFADAVRCVFGNPWRRVRFPRDGEIGPGEKLNVDRESVTLLDPCILSWSNGDLPRMAQEIAGGVCSECDDGRVWNRQDHPDYIGTVPCKLCRGTGRTPSDYSRSRLLILADAYQEAAGDAACEDVWRHLRGESRCPMCLGTTKVKFQSSMHVAGSVCKCGTGWIPSHAECVPGCWAVDLFLMPKETT